MARTENIVISSPGRLPNYVVGLDIPDDDEIDPASITITVSDAIDDYVSAEGADVNDSVETVDGQDYDPGHAIVFDLVCLEGAPAYDEDSPVYVLIDYATLDADEQRLRYRKVIEIYPFIDLP